MPTLTDSSRPRRRATLRPRLDDLENRRLLSASIYTVNSTGNGTSGSGDSGTLPYVIGLANIDPNVDGSEIQFSPAVFSSPQTVTLANTLALLESPGPEVIEGPAAALTISGGGPSSNFSDISVRSGVSARITGLTIANGNTTGGGGGVYNGGQITLADVTLSGNSAVDGGGLLNLGEATLANDTFFGNSATYGGGIGNHSTVALTNVTISGNSAVNGGGGIANGGTATLINSLLASNSGGDIEFNSVNGANNLIDDAASAGGLSNGSNGNIVGVNPLLAAPGNYGGPTQTLALLPGSPALDAGNTALAVDGEGNPLTTDQRGMPRVVGAAVDIGAFESSGFTLAIVAGNNQSTPANTAFPTALAVSVTPNNPGDPVDGGLVTFTAPASGASATFSPPGPVTIASRTASVTATANGILGGPYSVTASTADASPVSFSLNNGQPVLVVTTLADSPTQGFTTLRDALALAASLGGSQTIVFAPGLTGTISLGTGLEISSSVTIEGPGASLLTVSGGGPSSNFSDFTVDSGVITTISGLTIANGYTSNNGGGVSNFGDLTLLNATVTGNSANEGGGIYDAGTATLENDTFSNNSAFDGGGVLSAGLVTLINSTLFGNSATFGGGIGNHATVVLTNVTISGNSAVNGGGGIADGGTATLNNSLLASNSGGDIDFGTVNGSNNLIDDAANAGGLSNGSNGNIVGVNPLLAAPGNYGGPTQTLALLPGSPALDAGDTALAVDGEGNPLTTDQRGMQRVVGAAVDIGAFESSGFTLAIVAGNNQSTPANTAFPTALAVSVTPNNPGDPVDGGVVTFTAPASGASATFTPSGPVTIASGIASVTATANGILGGPYSVTASTADASPVSFSLNNGQPVLVVTTLADSPTQGFTTLRDALALAASLGGSQTIVFAPGLTGTISLGAGLEISSSVTIDGPGASLLTVSGGGPLSNFSDFTVDSGVTATIFGLTIANGYTSNNGGGVSNFGDLTLLNATVTGNSANEGGGIYDAGTATLENDTFSNNSAFDGGGVLSAGLVTLINSTLFGNSATFGGGIGNHSAVVLTNVTIAGNSAVNGGGGIADGGTATLNNSLLASNSGGDIDFGTVNGSNNLIDDAANAGGLSNGSNGNIVGVNPLLAAPGNYGGPTQTLALLPGSPALDAGDTALAVDGEGNPLTTDQRGMPRVVGAAVDIGAFESSGFTLAIVAGNNQSTLVTTAFPTALAVSVTPNNPGDPVDGGVVTFTAPASGASATFSPSGPVTIASGTASVTATANGIPGGPYSVTAATGGASPVSFSLTNTGTPSLVVTTLADSPTQGFTTLRDALALAASLGGSQTITFAPGLTGTISLGTGLEISSSVTIDGPGASLLTVSGGGASSNFSDFTVDSGVTATISGLTIANGYTSNNGGGVSNGGDLTLSNDTVTGNSAVLGGGIYDAGTATLENDTFSDNSASDGGGVLSAGIVTLINSTLFANSATFGGGIGNHSTVVLTNVTIAGNSAVNGGGGIADGGTATLNNSLLASNSGGDIDFGTVNGSNNLIDDAANAGGLSNGSNGNIVGVNPLLAAPGNYGGPTQTLALLPGSPALDAGDTALAVDGEGNPLTTDQRGMPRVVGAAVDIGAFESSGFTLAIVAGNNQSTPANTVFPTALAVSVTPNNPGDPVDGGVVTFTAPASGASATFSPSGPVTIASGTASVTATANGIPGGPYSVTAATGGASPVSFSLTNTGVSTLTSVSSSINPSTYGQSVKFTATVGNASAGGVAPTGTVTFMDGSLALSTVQLVRGKATYTTGGLPAGPNSITAVYNGDATHAPSTSAVLTETVNQDATATTVRSSHNPSTYGQLLTFTAIVKAAAPGNGTPTGTVTFMDGSTSLDTVTLSGGEATFATNLLGSGSHTITVVYNGDGNFVTSTSAPLNQTVTQASTTTKVTSSLNPSVYGEDVTFTATIKVNAPGGGTPTGTVSFMDGSAVLQTETLSGGVATFSTSTLSVGVHSITAVYSGDADFTASTSPVLNQKVKQGSSASLAVSTLDPSSMGWSVTTGSDGNVTASRSTSADQRARGSAVLSAAGSAGPLVDLAIGTLQDDGPNISSLDDLAGDLIALRSPRRVR